MQRTLLSLLLLFIPVLVHARSIRLPIVSDAGISSVVGEMNSNGGASVTIPIRQNHCWQGFEAKTYLFKFDSEPIRGFSVDKAWLNVFIARGDLFGVGLSTVLADWEEGGGLNGQMGKGGVSWNWQDEPDDYDNPAPANLWSWPGSGIFSVSWAHPDARYHHAPPSSLQKTPLPEGDIIHLRIPVAGDLIEAVATGLATSLIMTDDKGQIAEAFSLKGKGTPYRFDPSKDIYIYTRDIQDPALRPYLEIEGGVDDTRAPSGVGEITIAAANAYDQSVTLRITAPSEDGTDGGAVLGYEVRYAQGNAGIDEEKWDSLQKIPLWAVPKPEAPGTRQDVRIFTLDPGDYTIGVRALDEAGNAGPVSVVKVTVQVTPDLSLILPKPTITKGLPGEVLVESKMELWAAEDLCKIDPTDGRILIDQENYDHVESYKKHNPVWSGGAGAVNLQAARGEVVAFQVILGRTDDPLTGIRVIPGDLTGNRGKIRAKGNINCFRTWYQDVEPRKEELTGPWERIVDKNHQAAWHPVACIPLGGEFDAEFSIPSMDNMGPDQKYQSVWVDIFVPQNTKAGKYKGTITVQANELQKQASIVVELEVYPFALPSEITWTVELNTYASSTLGPEHLCGFDVEKEYGRYLTTERRYYQLAHQHRTTMNVLPFNQYGQVGYNFAPELSGEGRGVKISSWKEWEKRFGQYLNGKAFTRTHGYNGPGEGVPVNFMYLPFHENWPLPVESHFGDRAEIKDRFDLAEWSKTSRPLEVAFDEDYKLGFVSAVSQAFKHFESKGYTKTNFQFYFNNKHYWKCSFFGMAGSRKNGSSYWLLDEPVDYDDYAAVRFFLDLGKQGYEKAGAGKIKVQYRTDVSQPEMTRGLWDGYCDLWNSSGLIDYASTAMFRIRRLPDEEYWRYGGGPKISGKLIDFQQNFFTLWCIGAIGALPYWNNLSGTDWFSPNELALVFTGNDYARSGRQYDGALPSVRLKAMRRAQQDMEYLNLLSAKSGWDEEKVRAALAGFADDKDSRVLKFDRLSSGELNKLRRAVAKALISK
jgi:hypothetical protein